MTANDVMKAGDVSKNFNEKLQIYFSFEELNILGGGGGVSTLLHLTVFNRIHAGIPLLLV